MDSSLDWDSIVFKELSFCMSCISEDLVKDKFPMQMLESPMEVLSEIKLELQVCLFSLIYFNLLCDYIKLLRQKHLSAYYTS